MQCSLSRLWNKNKNSVLVCWYSCLLELIVISVTSNIVGVIDKRRKIRRVYGIMNVFYIDFIKKFFEYFMLECFL